MNFLTTKTLKNKYNIGVIGLGYVGLPQTIELAKKFKIICYDVNSERIKKFLNCLLIHTK